MASFSVQESHFWYVAHLFPAVTLLPFNLVNRISENVTTLNILTVKMRGKFRFSVPAKKTCETWEMDESIAHLRREVTACRVSRDGVKLTQSIVGFIQQKQKFLESIHVCRPMASLLILLSDRPTRCRNMPWGDSMSNSKFMSKNMQSGSCMFSPCLHGFWLGSPGFLLHVKPHAWEANWGNVVVCLPMWPCDELANWQGVPPCRWPAGAGMASS